MDKIIQFYSEDDNQINENSVILPNFLKKEEITNNKNIISNVPENTQNLNSSNISKIRNIPHIDGNFSCSIYFKIKPSKKIQKIKEKISEKLKENSLYSKEFHFTELNFNEYHITISKVFFLKFHQINNFLKNFKEKLISNKFLINEFNLILINSCKFLNNDQKTRFFLTLELIKSNKFKDFILFTNAILKEFNFPPFYQVDLF